MPPHWSHGQANEAKSAAVEEVERLLQHSEDLKRLHTLCQDYDHKAQVGIDLTNVKLHDWPPCKNNL
jgi:hypothetical protein